MTHPEHLKQFINDPFAAEQRKEQAGCYHPRNKMRQIGRRLNDALIAEALHLVEQHGEDDRNRKPENQIEKAQHQRVAQNAPELIANVLRKIREKSGFVKN